MVTWEKDRVESYARQFLTALLSNPAASEELVATALHKTGGDQSSEVTEWAERWASIAFDVAEVFAAEADQRDEDSDCRLLDND